MNEVIVDKEYVIMSEIEENNTLTQRELSNKLGVSVSTVNVLINKMIKEGLIKINQVSKRQVLYMLTPNGILEKTQKTMRYLKAHYKAIYETKEKIKSVLEMLTRKHDIIFILMPEDEMGEIVKIAVEEYELLTQTGHIKKIESITCLDYDQYQAPLLLYVQDNLIQNVSINKLNLMSVL